MVENARHIIMLGVLESNIAAHKPFRCFWGMLDSSYHSRFDGGLKMTGMGIIITSYVKG